MNKPTTSQNSDLLIAYCNADRINYKALEKSTAKTKPTHLEQRAVNWAGFVLHVLVSEGAIDTTKLSEEHQRLLARVYEKSNVATLARWEQKGFTPKA